MGKRKTCKGHLCPGCKTTWEHLRCEFATMDLNKCKFYVQRCKNCPPPNRVGKHKIHRIGAKAA
jgi:hypothetical protein